MPDADPLIWTFDSPQGRIHRTHGESVFRRRSPEYNSWRGMVERCSRPKHCQYAEYGGRGISVFPEWIGRAGFVKFLEHVGRKPSRKHQIDRIDNNGNYEPGNVRWVTASENCRNKKNNLILTVNGESHCISEWAEITGIPKRRIHSRKWSLGWSDEDCLRKDKKVNQFG